MEDDINSLEAKKKGKLVRERGCQTDRYLRLNRHLEVALTLSWKSQQVVQFRSEATIGLTWWNDILKFYHYDHYHSKNLPLLLRHSTIRKPIIPRKVLGTLNYPWINSDLKENKQSPVSWQISKPELKILIRTTIPGNIDGQLQTLQVLTNAPQLRFVGWLSILSYVQNLCLPMYNLHVIREIVLCLLAVKYRRFISTWKSEQMFQNVFQRFFIAMM